MTMMMFLYEEPFAGAFSKTVGKGPVQKAPFQFCLYLEGCRCYVVSPHWIAVEFWILTSQVGVQRFRQMSSGTALKRKICI